eukprot:6183228-Pleurochrysis_carterae.AAC.2
MPGSGVRGLKESISTIDSDCARPLSGFFVIDQLQLVGGTHAHDEARMQMHYTPPRGRTHLRTF